MCLNGTSPCVCKNVGGSFVVNGFGVKVCFTCSLKNGVCGCSRLCVDNSCRAGRCGCVLGT